jgi:predicted kinase
LAPFIDPAPGAIHVRSDVERKALFDVEETERLGPAFYSDSATSLIYDQIFSRADRALAAGHSVILDAVFSRSEQRAKAEQLARARGLAFRGVWLEAPPQTLAARVSSRRYDASDATVDVVNQQLTYDLGEITWLRLDASGSSDETVLRVRGSILEAADAHLQI